MKTSKRSKDVGENICISKNRGNTKKIIFRYRTHY